MDGDARGGVAGRGAGPAGDSAGGQPFPGRDLIQFLTFWVIFATLVGQGLTLPLLIRVLGLGKIESRAADDADSSADKTRIKDTD